MNLYKNFKLIEKWRLSHPKWEFVKSAKDLTKFKRVKDYCGWTVRVLFTKSDDFRSPIYVNWLPKSQVFKKVDEFAKKAKKDYVIVLYPSWKLNKSGALLIEKNRIIIEACKGSIDDLMRNGILELRLIYGRNKKLKDSWGNAKFLSTSERKKILSALSRVKRKNLILEWAIGQKGEFFFQKLEDVKQAGKLLLKKYS